MGETEIPATESSSGTVPLECAEDKEPVKKEMKAEMKKRKQTNEQR